MRESVDDFGEYSIKDYITDLMKELVPPLPTSSPTSFVQTYDDIDVAPLHTTRRAAWRTNPSLISLRLSKHKPHYLETGHKKMECKYCTKSVVVTACVTCRAALCTPVVGEGESSCFYAFHNYE